MKLESWHSPKTEVRNGSTIQGSGLFAIEIIFKDEVIAVKGGHIADKTMLDAAGDCVRGSSLKITSELFVAPLTNDEKISTMVYFNHSCDANVGMAGNIISVAMRDIKPGEELTVDYAMFDDGAISFSECNCQSVNCRKKLTGNDWRDLSIQQRYKGYFTWYIQQRINLLNK